MPGLLQDGLSPSSALAAGARLEGAGSTQRGAGNHGVRWPVKPKLAGRICSMGQQGGKGHKDSLFQTLCSVQESFTVHWP